MRIPRRAFLPGVIALPAILTNAQENSAPPDPANLCIGSWFVTRAQTSLILGIEPKGGVLFIFIEKGAFTIGRNEWKEAPGGIMVEGIPRFRLWAPNNPQERIRAEMEELPKEFETSKGFQTFPLSFFMSRAELRPNAKNLLDRPLPKGWDQPRLKPEWDQSAGKARPLN
jgi:hypothetical protein